VQNNVISAKISVTVIFISLKLLLSAHYIQKYTYIYMEWNGGILRVYNMRCKAYDKEITNTILIIKIGTLLNK